MNASNNRFPAKIIGLWTVFLLGTLFHTQLALMPLFHGLSVVESHTHEYASLATVMWFMLVFFTLPLLAILGCLFWPSRQFRNFHFGMTLIYTVLNFLHWVVDGIIGVPGYQLFLMALLFGVGLLLNGVSYQWIRASGRSVKRLTSSLE